MKKHIAKYLKTSSKLYHFEQYEPCEAKKTARNIIWKVHVHGIHYLKP